MKPDEHLEVCKVLFQERGAVYGENYKKVPAALKALFPDGLTLNTLGDFERFYLLCFNLSKIGRYANNINRGGHMDSAMDLVTYASMLASVTKEPERG